MSDWICICPQECPRFPPGSPFEEIWELVKQTQEKREALKQVIKERRRLLKILTRGPVPPSEERDQQEKASDEDIEKKAPFHLTQYEDASESDEEEEEDEEFCDSENLPKFGDYFKTARLCVEKALEKNEWEINGSRFNKLWSISMCEMAKYLVIKLIRELAKEENKWAIYNLGMMICTKVIQNQETFEEGLSYLSKACKLGCPGAYNCLGVFFQTGYSGLKWDPKKAIQLYKSAIQLKCARAMCNLGELLCEGVPNEIEKQEKIGMELIRKAARSGNPRGLYLLGVSYFHAKCGVARDKNKGADLIYLAAEAGDPSAQDMMGTLYSIGTPHFKKSYEEAFYYFSISALNNNTAGMRDLGMSYVEGVITKRDLVKGLFWYNMALIRGDEPSKELIPALEAYFPGEYQEAYNKSIDLIQTLHKELIEQNQD